MSKPKFAKVPDSIRQAAISEYLAGGVTQKEVGRKFGFDYRRLVGWCKAAGQHDAYLQASKNNQFETNTRPMADAARLKISGFNHVCWKGRKLDVSNGEICGILIPAPEHPNANAQGYVYEHRLVMEQQLGRLLTSDELVHHIDLDPTNNVPENLMVLSSRREHGRLHLCLQLALVKLMAPHELRRLTHYLLGEIRRDTAWRPAKTKRDKKHARGTKDAGAED